MAAAPGRVEPAPRRVRGVLADQVVFDTTSALYVWETPYYPQYYLPLADVAQHYLIEVDPRDDPRPGITATHDLRVAQVQRSRAARVHGVEAATGVVGHVRFQWEALDAWFEEDEQIYLHPRNPYVRVDALRSHRRVRIEVDGVVLADTGSPVMVFETGLPTRYYIDRTDVRFEHLVRADTVSVCPYKGSTSEYWSVVTPAGRYPDLAWSYRSTTDGLSAIAGMVAFYDEKVDVLLDGQPQPRPVTHF